VELREYNKTVRDSGKVMEKVLKNDRGFTLMELLVASSLGALIMGLVTTNILVSNNVYFEDVIRTSINSNLRAGMDIMSTNIRQAGENLQPSFPAVEVIDGTGDDPDTLILRRNRQSEVLSVCNDISAGNTTADVSDDSRPNSVCQMANANRLFANFEAQRVNEGGSTRVFLYNQVTNTGEFVEFSGTDLSTNIKMIITGPSASYPAISSSIYLVEEFRFSLDPVTETLELYIDGDLSTPAPVAFDTNQLLIEITMQDGTVLNTFDAGAGHLWKDIEQIQVTLGGEVSRRDRTMSSSITAEYFPRNVLSS